MAGNIVSRVSVGHQVRGYPVLVSSPLPWFEQSLSTGFRIIQLYMLPIYSRRVGLPFRSTCFGVIAVMVVLLALPGTALGQFGPQIQGPESYVSWSVRPIPSGIGNQDTTVVKISATIAEDWKMYALDASLPSMDEVLTRPYGVVVSMSDSLVGLAWSGSVGQSPPEADYDEIFDMNLKWFYESASFYTAVVSGDSVSGTFEIPLAVRYQICNDEIGVCLRPDTAELSTVLSVDPSCVDCSATNEDVALTTNARLEAADTSVVAGTGFLPFILLAIGAGLASLLTPCVFPMIPLTVSYFTKYGHTRREAVRLALLYGSAIVVTFTSIGIVMAVLVGSAGALVIAANPWVNVFIALVLVGFALSLLGLYEIRVPSSLLTWVNARGGEDKGWAGVLFMGLTLTLVSFSCTAPFVGGLLAAASTGTWAYPLLGMVAYSTTFALPFVLLALFPRSLDRLPKSGSWMNSLKVVLGFVELAAAVKFFSNADLVWGLGVLPRTLGVFLVFVCTLLIGLYLMGWLRLGYAESIRPSRLRQIVAVIFIISALRMAPGMAGQPLGFLDAYLPPHQDADRALLARFGIENAEADHEEGWVVDDIEKAFALAAERNVAVMVDFSGYTCTNCRDMEANIFPRPEVKARLDSAFVPLRLYTDDLQTGDAFHAFQMDLTGTPALPTYAIVHPADSTVIAQQSAMMSEREFIAFLDNGSSDFRTRR